MAPTCACSIASFSPPSCIDGIHLHAEPAVGRRFEFLAEIFDRDDGRIAGRMNVRRLE